MRNPDRRCSRLGPRAGGCESTGLRSARQASRTGTSSARRRSRCRASAARCSRKACPACRRACRRDMVKGYQPPAEAPPPVDRGETPPGRSRRRPRPRRAARRRKPQVSSSQPATAAASASRRPPRATTQPVQPERGRDADHAGRATDVADQRAAGAADPGLVRSSANLPAHATLYKAAQFRAAADPIP